jgi:RNA polymerase sigma factor (sigma-70 family)
MVCARRGREISACGAPLYTTMKAKIANEIGNKIVQRNLPPFSDFTGHFSFAWHSLSIEGHNSKISMINQCMHVEDLSLRERLERIVRQLAPDAASHDDLMQEALVHLWLREARFPGQKPSWYLQSCKFHLQHYLEAGRSVDSNKRRAGQIQLPEDEEGDAPLPEHRTSDTSFFSQISARELLNLLSKGLTSRERAILDCLADGLGAREIARKLNITHPTATKSRRKIAKLVIELGFASSARAGTKFLAPDDDVPSPKPLRRIALSKRLLPAAG